MWREEDRPVTDECAEPVPAEFSVRPRPRLRRTLAEGQAACRDGAVLVDARPRHLFLGERDTANTGHIPGALCLPYQELVDGATGLWAAPAAVARLAGNRGYSVAVNFLDNEAAAQAVVKEIRSSGGSAVAIRGDVALEADIVHLFQEAEQGLGAICGLVNNAGVTGGFSRGR